jgi:spore coat polysaccharide biosynthesis predicted glycosyltransferase SpsG
MGRFISYEEKRVLSAKESSFLVIINDKYIRKECLERTIIYDQSLQILTREKLIDQIYLCAYDEKIRRTFFNNSQLLVDGHGASRVVSEIENLSFFSPHGR